MPKITIEVSDDYRHICEMKNRSMAAQARMVLNAFTARDDLRKAIGAWEDEAVADALRPARVACASCKGTGKSAYGACGACSGSGVQP